MSLESAHQNINNHLKEFLRQGFLFPWGEECLLGWGDLKQVSKASSRGVSLYAPDFYLEEPHPWKIFSHVQVVSKRELLNVLASVVRRPPQRKWSEPDADGFHQIFKKIKATIDGGRMQKAVPVVFATSEGGLETPELAYLIGQAVQAPSHLYPYGYWSDGEGILGVTPELLFDVSQSENTLVTMALAGTRSEGIKTSLLHDSKEVLEHQLVVKDLEEILKNWGSIEKGRVQESGAGSIVHLKTDLKVRLTSDQWEFEDFVKGLHPTPALGLFPRQDNWGCLKDWQIGNYRGRYGAPFGVFVPGERSLCLVSIRNWQWRPNMNYLGSGCGIVSASLEENEWVELTGKRQSVLRFLCPETLQT